MTIVGGEGKGVEVGERERKVLIKRLLLGKFRKGSGEKKVAVENDFSNLLPTLVL